MKYADRGKRRRSAGGKDIFKFQLVTARYGRDFLEFNIKWYEGLLSEIRSEKI